MRISWDMSFVGANWNSLAPLLVATSVDEGDPHPPPSGSAIARVAGLLKFLKWQFP